MPYTKQEGHDDCKPGQWAVVNKETGRLMACHATEESADKQIAALASKEPVEKSSRKASRWVDQFAAAKVLSGEPVCILPRMDDGYVRWGTRRDPITPTILAAVLSNFERRDSIAGLTVNVPVTVEHEEGRGKIGILKTMALQEDGLYGTFDFTPYGEELLDGGSFDYLSPEVYWEFEDIDTGEAIGPTIIGVSVTNYPFFGERTAMYSRKAAETLLRSFDYTDLTPDDALPPEVFELSSVADQASRHGWQLFDIDGGAGPAVVDPREHAGIIGVLENSLGFATERSLEIMSAVCLTREGGDGWKYPRSAWLLRSEGTDAWSLRVKSYNTDRVLDWDAALLLEAAESVTDAGLWADHAEFFGRHGIDAEDVRNSEQEDVMPEGNGEGNGNGGEVVSPEEFATVQGQVDLLTTRLADRDAQLALMARERVVEQFTREAEAFTAIGVESEQYAAHMAWLQEQDPEGEHLAFFRELVSTADTAIANGAAFEEHGTTRKTPRPSDAQEAVEQAVTAMAKEQGITDLRPGTETYGRLLGEVLKASPELFADYRRQVTGKEVV